MIRLKFDPFERGLGVRGIIVVEIVDEVDTTVNSGLVAFFARYVVLDAVEGGLGEVIFPILDQHLVTSLRRFRLLRHYCVSLHRLMGPALRDKRRSASQAARKFIRLTHTDG